MFSYRLDLALFNFKALYRKINLGLLKHVAKVGVS